MEKLDSVSSLKDGRLFTVPQFHTFTLTGCSHCSVFTLPCSTLIFLEYTATSHVRVEIVCICCKMANISKMIPWIIHDGYYPYHGKPIDAFFPLETNPLSVLLVIRRFFGVFPVLMIIIRYKELRTHRWSQLISEKGDKIYFKVILFFFFYVYHNSHNFLPMIHSGGRGIDDLKTGAGVSSKRSKAGLQIQRMPFVQMMFQPTKNLHFCF